MAVPPAYTGRTVVGWGEKDCCVPASDHRDPHFPRAQPLLSTTRRVQSWPLSKWVLRFRAAQEDVSARRA